MEVWDSVKVVLAFSTRTSALVILVLLYSRFAQVPGEVARHFRYAFAALAFLLLWVWVGSVAELVQFIQGASMAVELGANYIFVPTLVITVGLARLLWRVQELTRAVGDLSRCEECTLPALEPKRGK